VQYQHHIPNGSKDVAQFKVFSLRCDANTRVMTIALRTAKKQCFFDSSYISRYSFVLNENSNLYILHSSDKYILPLTFHLCELSNYQV
jgi:hypothetical protein